jgi:hypothetical protein
MTTIRSETMPQGVSNRAIPADLLDLAMEEMRVIGVLDSRLGRGSILACGALSTGSANDAIAVLGRGLIPASWRQARGTIDPAGANNGLIWEMIAPGDVGEDLARTKTITYDTAKFLVFAPLAKYVLVYMVAGAGHSVTASGTTITVTFLPGTTTYANVLADWNACAAAVKLATLTGTAGTLPATFEGGTISLSNAPIVEIVQAVATAVDWSATTRILTIGLDLAGGGDTVANILIALAASASGAEYVVQARNVHGSTGLGSVTTAACVSLTGGAGKAMRRAKLTMAQGAHKDLEFEARNAGEDVETIFIRILNVAAADPPTVEVRENYQGSETVKDVRITIRAKVGTSTALHILQAIRDSAAAQYWISARLADGSNGSGATTAFAWTVLGSGADDAALALIAGTVPMTGITTLTDDGFTVWIPALGGSHPATSSAKVQARICGILHEIDVTVIA